MKTKLSLAGLLATGLLLFAGCDFDVPLTAKPTQKVDPRLLGDWAAVDKDAKEEELMHVRQWDESTYAVSIDHDIYRVYHSDFAGIAFVTAQDLNSPDRKYCFYRWSLSADGRTLTLQGIDEKLVPGETKTTAAIQKLIKDQLANPALFDKEILTYTRKKPR
jgi:hypothetical protein